jgi:hypothetical protein
MRRLLLLAAIFTFAACDNGECSADYGKTEDSVRRGGWDGNGRSLFALHDAIPALSGSTIELATLGENALEIFDINENGLVARTGEGRVLSGAELAGTELKLRSAADQVHLIHITGSTPGSFERYEITVDGKRACPEGQVGAFMKGYWNNEGTKIARGVSFACETGAAFKCADWGYAPWDNEEVHQSCTRMVRADYCGDGRSFTRDGTLILISNNAGDLEGTREAGWDASGATCVDHARFEAYTANGAEQLPSCFADLPSCEEDDDALLYNGSQISNLIVCEE